MNVSASMRHSLGHSEQSRNALSGKSDDEDTHTNRKVLDLTQPSLLDLFNRRLFLRVYCSAMNPVVRHEASKAVSCVRIACREGIKPLEAFEKLVITCFEALVSFIPALNTAILNVCFE